MCKCVLKLMCIHHINMYIQMCNWQSEALNLGAQINDPVNPFMMIILAEQIASLP